MRNKIIENDKFVWYSSEETALAAEYLKTRGLNEHYVAIAVSKLDDREEYVLLRADSTGATSAVFAASMMSEVVEYIDALSKTLNDTNE